jgi:transposase
MSGEVSLQRTPRKWLSANQKLTIVRESLEPGTNVAEIARKYNVSVSSLIKWRKLAATGSLMSVKSEEGLVPANDVKKLKHKVRELERMLGKKTMQVELLQEAVELAREKKLISRQPLPGVDDIPND